jgi:epoxyqueuosine reductase QueG
MDLESRLPHLARELGADYYGVADLNPATAFISEQGGEWIARFPRAVVMGIVLLDTVVDILPGREDPAVAILYRHTCYDVVNQALDQIGLQVANTIRRKGYKALPIPASKRSSDKKIAGVFSQKLAAHLAGLGWIGKSCLLVTPDHGPRVRWVTILTDAPLAPTGAPMEPRCGDCTACVDACPVHAFTGRTFREDEGREARFNAALCDRYFKDLEKSGRPPVCGMCLCVCPHGRNKGRVSPGSF